MDEEEASSYVDEEEEVEEVSNEDEEVEEEVEDEEEEESEDESDELAQKETADKVSPLYVRPKRRKQTSENEELLDLLKPTEDDIMKLLAAQSHLGRSKTNCKMNRYVWRKRPDGVRVINLEKTWAKLILAARILVTVREPSDIAVMSTRTYGHRGCIKFAQHTGATPIVGKWVPGTFTNPQNKIFIEPRVLIVDDPKSCLPALRETSYTGVPVIAFSGLDSDPRFVDCAIPCNNRGRLSVGLMFWFLARELLRMRGTIMRKFEWKEPVDLFFYRDPDEIQKQQDARLAKQRRAAQEAAFDGQQGAIDEYGTGALDDQGQYGYDEYDDNQQQQEWDMPDTRIEDWDQGGQQQQAQQAQQGQQYQQYDDNEQYDENAPQDEYDDNQGAMDMQTW